MRFGWNILWRFLPLANGLVGKKKNLKSEMLFFCHFLQRKRTRRYLNGQEWMRGSPSGTGGWPEMWLAFGAIGNGLERREAVLSRVPPQEESATPEDGNESGVGKSRLGARPGNGHFCGRPHEERRRSAVVKKEKKVRFEKVRFEGFRSLSRARDHLRWTGKGWFDGGRSNFLLFFGSPVAYLFCMILWLKYTPQCIYI